MDSGIWGWEGWEGGERDRRRREGVRPGHTWVCSSLAQGLSSTQIGFRWGHSSAPKDFNASKCSSTDAYPVLRTTSFRKPSLTHAHTILG